MTLTLFVVYVFTVSEFIQNTIGIRQSLAVNQQKAKNKKIEKLIDAKVVVETDGYKLEEVVNLKYLGVIINNKNERTNKEYSEDIGQSGNNEGYREK